MEIAEKLWTLVSFAALLGSIYIILKAADKKVSILKYFLIYSFAMLSFPVKFTLGLGQINIILLFLISLCFLCYRSHRPYIAGAVLGFACAIKLTPIFFLLFFIRKKQYKVLIASISSILLLVILGILLFGQAVTSEYYSSILPDIPTVGNGAYYNQALTGLLERSAIPLPLATLINYGVFAILLATSFIWTKREKQTSVIELGEYGLFITAVLIGAGLSWQHHFTMLIIPYMAVFLVLTEKKWQQASIYLFALILSYLLVAVNIKNPDTFSGISVLLLSHVLYGTVILFILLQAQLSRKIQNLY